MAFSAKTLCSMGITWDYQTYSVVRVRLGDESADDRPSAAVPLAEQQGGRVCEVESASFLDSIQDPGLD